MTMAAMDRALDRNNGLKCLNSELPDSWEAKLVPDVGRIYYLDHKTQSSSWLPPRENWDPGNTGLPYGWESAVDKNKKPYFINHVENYTTRDDPRDDPDYIEPPKPREVELVRDAQKGFGFVAGSEKPVVVRFVTEGGPSVDKLLPGDQLIKINGQDVKKAPREFVIDLVRSCKHSISLTVCQPYTDNSARKSALLTAAKKDRLKKNPSRVRFAEEIIVNGASVPSNSPEESYVPFMPNVLKVFLENGQTKSFKYDNKTTVKDVVYSLQEKLSITDIHHFNLVLHNMKSHMPGRMTLLQEHETVAEIASRPGARHFRCLFRIVYVPKDSYDLLKQDPTAFEYFYMQCVNDVLQDRFSELKPDLIMRLSALHIQQHAMTNNVTGKINIKSIEKEFGLEKFVPQSIRDNMKVKDLRKVLAQSLKMNQNLTAPGQKQLTALQAKLHYMKIVSELKTFGSRVFMVTLLDKRTEAMVLVGPKSGVSLVTNIRFYTLSMLADFKEIQSIKVAKEKDNMNRVELSVKGDEPGLARALKNMAPSNNNNDKVKTLNLGLLKEDATNFVSMVNGYYRIFVDPGKSLIQKNAGRQGDDPDIPPFESKHTVITAPWSYPEDIVSMVIGEDAGTQGKGTPDNERMIDLSRGAPGYEGNQDFISKLKQDLGIKSNSVKEGQQLEEMEDVTAPTKANTKAVKDTTSVPVKTVIEIKNPSVSPGVPRRSVEKNDSKSLSTGSTGGNSQSPDRGPEPVVKVAPKRRWRSPTPDARKRIQYPLNRDGPEYVNTTRRGYSESFSEEMEEEEAPYVNSGPREDQVFKKLENGDNNSDSDSGVGGEPEKSALLIHNSVSGKSSSAQAEDKNEEDSWDTPSDTASDTATVTSTSTDKGRSQLPMHSELHIDLSSLVDPSFGYVAAGEVSPTSTTSPDPESTSFIGQYDPDQLPQEIQDAVYDPRMFYQQELYIDPDIIDLTLLPPFPPTEEELAELGNRVPNLPPSPRVGMATSHHSRLLKTSSVASEILFTKRQDSTEEQRPVLHKSASVGYCPDFLDDDIDDFINKVKVQPPPSDNDVTESSETRDSDRLGQSWNGPIGGQENGGLEFDNPEMSRTVDLGELALGDHYSSLVIPPPPESSFSLEDIPIVPPVEPVKERRKKFENLDSGSIELMKSKNSGKKTSSNSVTNSKVKEIDGKGVKTNENRMNESETKQGSVQSESKETAHDSPASVSEKLNELLKSLSSSEEPTGRLRRTSSLRLGRCSSLDFLNTPQASEKDKNSDLVTGSVRLKPKVRPGLNLDRTVIHNNGNVHVPLRASSSDGIAKAGHDASENRAKFANSKLAYQRTHSFDVLPTPKSDQSSSSESESPVSDFASLKAKLQSYRDSLLNRSLRRKKTMQDSERSSLDGDSEEAKSPLKRSNSFTNLIRRSIKRSSLREKSVEKRSSSGSRESTEDEAKESPVLSARERKIWNTLTTPRSNFRPNTASGQTQVRKQKAGPLKALSSVFDDHQSEAKTSSSSEADRSPKRQAPEVPSTPPPALTSVTSTSSRSQSLSPTPVTLTKPLTVPMVPPRRKHGNTAGSDSPKQKSKDDTELVKHTNANSNVKVSPFATLGKMWRPMSMASSSVDIDLDESYKTFNNFDALREMSAANSEKKPIKLISNGHVTNAPVVIPPSAVISKSSEKSSPDGNLVSERSFALLKEKTNPSNTNSVKQILGTVYTSEDFVQATNDVDRLLNELKQTMESLKSSRIDRKPAQFDMCKDELQSQVRQFVTDAKLLVSNATQTKQKLAANMDASMHSLAKIFLHGQATMFMMEAIHQAQHLGSEVIRVANAYKSTLNAAHAAVGKPLADPHMKYLMRQATNLASLLSTLLKSLKTLEQK